MSGATVALPTPYYLRIVGDKRSRYRCIAGRSGGAATTKFRSVTHVMTNLGGFEREQHETMATTLLYINVAPTRHQLYDSITGKYRS